jgi:hypothetical protein
MRKLLGLALLGVMLGCLPLARAADEPSLQDVNSAVRAGRLADAQTMMQTVLRDHPNSAKAHFVEAEVLERMSRFEEARGELARAEQLEPGLSSIRPETVQELRAQLAGGARAPAALASREGGAGGFPWGPVLLIAGAGLILFLVLRARRPAMAPGTGIVPAGAAPYGAPYGGTPYGAAPMGGGMGSGILGGLATGAAVGAGMVAGEALAHEFIGNHDRDRAASSGWSDDGSRVASVDNSDLGVDGNWDSGGGDIASGMGGGSDDWG